METEGLNGTKPKAGEMQVMLTLYQLSSSLPAMAPPHPLWVSKNSPGPKSGEASLHKPRAGAIEPGSADAAQSPGSMAPHRRENIWQRYENLSSQKHRSLNPIQ